MLIGKIAEDALVLDDGVVGPAELAVTFAQTENRGGCQLPVLVKLRDERLVIGNGRVEVAVGLLLEQPLAQRGTQIVCLRPQNHCPGQNNRTNEPIRFHRFALFKCCQIHPLQLSHFCKIGWKIRRPKFEIQKNSEA